jgi:hypothetical protein
MTGKELDKYIKQRVHYYLKSKKRLNNYDSIFSDTFAELIDKLIIVHIRYWNLEDAMGKSKTATKTGELKQKADNLFKEKRPSLVQSLDKLIIQLTKGHISYTPSNNKIYKSRGHQK